MQTRLERWLRGLKALIPLPGDPGSVPTLASGSSREFWHLLLVSTETRTGMLIPRHIRVWLKIKSFIQFKKGKRHRTMNVVRKSAQLPNRPDFSLWVPASGLASYLLVLKLGPCSWLWPVSCTWKGREASETEHLIACLRLSPLSHRDQNFLR